VAPGTEDRTRKAATAARIYDYYLGGTHNFPADIEAAKQIVAQYPMMPAVARANRAFLRRAVGYLVDAGVRQFLDIGSGMPTVGNVHEIAQQAAADSRVVYVDIDTVAVAESQELLGDNPLATAIRGDVRTPEEILDHPQVRKLLDFDQPIALLMVALLHFLPDDDVAHRAVSTLVDALPPGSYLAISHGTTEGLQLSSAMEDAVTHNQEVYRKQTATPLHLRSQAEIARFFTSAELVEPGLVPVLLWRPAPDDPTDFADNPAMSGVLAAVGRVHPR
jgi:O-methyltransferase involved in polyketide biosynthesis